MHIFYSKFYQCEDLKVIFTSFFSPRKPFSGFTLVYTPNVWHHSLWHGTIGNISVICYCGTIGQPLQCSCTPLQLDMKSLLIKRWVESQTVETLLYSLGFKTFSQNLSIFTIVKFSMAFKGHSSDLVTITLWLWQQFDRLETKFLAFSNSFNCWFRHSNGWYCCWNSWRFRLNGSCCCSNDWYLRSNGSCCCTNRFQWSYEWIPMVIQTVCWKSKRFMQSFEWYV